MMTRTKKIGIGIGILVLLFGFREYMAIKRQQEEMRRQVFSIIHTQQDRMERRDQERQERLKEFKERFNSF
tara:strand:- start:1318 stop:1530 length:213 start_codon:yes stop_codon:yes gene_type:complete